MILPLDKPILFEVYCDTPHYPWLYFHLRADWRKKIIRIVGIVRNDNESFAQVAVLASDYEINEFYNEGIKIDLNLVKSHIKSWELAGELLLFLGYKYRTPLLASMVSNTYTEAGHARKATNNELAEKR